MKSDSDRRQNAAMFLSTAGAAIAGAGFGLLFAELLRPYGVAILAVGVVAHLVGMIGKRRSEEATGYVPAAWETAGYWLCWAVIVLLAAFIAAETM